MPLNPQTLLALHRPGAASDVLPGRSPVKAPVPPAFAGVRRTIGLPELSEVDGVRHFTRLSQESHGVDNGPYPLGSCTMKYNPKRNDALAALDGFARVHPLQPVASDSPHHPWCPKFVAPPFLSN